MADPAPAAAGRIPGAFRRRVTPPTAVRRRGAGAVSARRSALLDRAGRCVVVAGALALAAHVAWMWIGGFHSQDGPSHMFAATALGHLLGGEPGAVGAVYEANLRSEPNWITYPVLAAGLRVASPAVAELALVSLLVAGMAAGLWYAVTAAGRRAAPLAVAGLPIAVGWSVHTGLYNFTASVALLLAVVGYHLRVTDRLDVRRACRLGALLVALYSSHPLSVVVAYVTVGVIWAATTGADVRRLGSWRPARRRTGLLLIALTPSALLMARFLADPEPIRPRAVPRDAWRSLLDTVWFRWPVGGVAPDDAGWAAVLAAATWCAVLAVVAHRLRHGDWRRWDLLAVVPLVTGAGAVLLPDRLAGGTLVQPRLAIYSALALLLWLACATAGSGLQRWVGIGLGLAGTLTLVALLHARIDPYRRIDAATAEVLTTAPSIAPGSLVLGAVSADAPALQAAVPMVHIVDRLLLAADAVPVLTLDAGSGYGPIRYRPRFDPHPALRGFPRNRLHGRHVAPEAFAAVARRYATVTGRAVDYVALVGYDPRPSEVARFRAEGFRLVRRSRPSGLVWLFRGPLPAPGVAWGGQRPGRPAGR